MNTHTGSCVTPRSSVLMGATVIHSEAGRKGPGWLWDWGQRVVNEKSMVLWHINLSPNFITGIRCQEKSVLWRWLAGPYWLSWPMCVVSWWKKWLKVECYRKIIKDNGISRTSSCCCWLVLREQQTVLTVLSAYSLSIIYLSIDIYILYIKCIFCHVCLLMSLLRNIYKFIIDHY